MHHTMPRTVPLMYYLTRRQCDVFTKCPKDGQQSPLLSMQDPAYSVLCLAVGLVPLNWNSTWHPNLAIFTARESTVL